MVQLVRPAEQPEELIRQSFRVPPHSIEAEQSVLGGLMLSNEAWDTVADRVSEEDFYRRDHRLIFRAIAGLANQDKPRDVVTLSEWLSQRGELDQAGGMIYLGTLAKDTPSAANIKAYADIVRARSVLRQLIQAGEEIAGSAYEPGERGIKDILDDAERRVFKIAEQGTTGRKSFQNIKDLLTQAVDRIDELFNSDSPITGVATGFDKFDEMTAGLQRSELIVVAGRPSMGKCLAYDSELVLDDGSISTIEEFYQHRNGGVGTLRDNFKLDRVAPEAYLDDGLKPVFEITTRLGRRVETTLPHPFLTLQGWKPLMELKAGDYIAVPRILPVFGKQALRECEVKLLAYLIGDGGLTGSSPRFTNTNADIAVDFAGAVADFGGLSLTAYFRENKAASWAVVSNNAAVASTRAGFAERLSTVIETFPGPMRSVARELNISPSTITAWKQGSAMPDQATLNSLCGLLKVESADLLPEGVDAARRNKPNPLVVWLRELGLEGKGAAEKHIPAAVFRLPEEQLALFLNRLFATDGWATVLRSGQSQLGYASISERLARQVQHLLLRFGVIAKVRQRWVRYRDTRRPSWQIDITHARSIRVFIDKIGIFGKQQAIQKVIDALHGRREQSNTDLLPVEIWKEIEKAKGSLSWSELACRSGVSDSNIHAHRRAISRNRLARFAMALNSSSLMSLAHSDVYWDRIESIIPLGMKQVFDLTIPDTHNFIANDICVHNTSFVMNIAEYVAIKQQLPVAVFSMEMGGEQLAMRMISSLGRINMQNLRTGRLEDSDWPRITSAISMLSEAPLFVDDTPALSPTDLRARARRIKREHGLGLIVVDYLQLMSVPQTKENRATEISEISRSLKSLAKELNVPVVALSQLNRGLEQRPDKRPVMSDLRESGAIEQDADVIAFIYRDEVYNEDSPEKGTAEILIRKQRNGPTGMCRLTFLGQYTKFENYSPEIYSSGQ